MSSANTFEGEFPEELRMHLDFVSNSVIVVIAYLLQHCGLIKDEHIPGLRAAAFMFALPALLMRLLWGAQLGRGMFYVVIGSIITHSLWIVPSLLLARLASPLNRGLFAMSVIGNGIPFVYPAVLSSPRFNEYSVSAAIIWDVAGTLWINIVYYAIVAKIYAPAKKDDPCVQTETTSEQSCSEAHATVVGLSSAHGCEISRCIELNAQELDTITVDFPTAAAHPIRVTVHRFASIPWYSIFVVVVQNPVIWAVFTGLSLNLLRIPRYPVPCKTLDVLASAFPPMLYALIGSTLQFSIGWESYGVVLRALLARCLVCGCVGMILRLPWWPFDAQTRGILTLCVISPIPSMFILHTSKYAYRSDQAAILYNMSAVLSMFAISLLAPVV